MKGLDNMAIAELKFYFGIGSIIVWSFGFLFMALKSTDIISWSWLWVTCPFWSVAMIFFVIFIINFIVVDSI